MTSMLTPRLSVRDLDLGGKRVFVRCDFNVPLDEGGGVADDTRIRSALPTLELALERGAALVLASHLGRPKGRPDPRASLAPVAARLRDLLGRDVTLTRDCTSEATRETCRSAAPGEVVLLENLRFHAEEKDGDAAFADALASLADRYVNDAFGTCHRGDASVALVPLRFDRPAAGLLVEAELRALGRVLDEPDRPFVAILGGAKVSDKLPVIRALVPKVDRLLVGGAMAYTILRARGEDVGASLVEDGLVDAVRELLAAAESRRLPLSLPTDHVVVTDLADEAAARIVTAGGFRPEDRGVDVGPATRRAFADAVGGAATVLWNGPLGIFERAAYAEGTRAVARAVADADAFTVVGGGDSVAALNEAGLGARVGHVSTGGGAMLELLAGHDLPGIAALAPAEPRS